MNLLDFEDYESDANIEKGNRYFRQGRVTFLRKVNREDWEANVQGRDVYDVVVTVDKHHEIQLTECNCPVFTEEDNCKHVIAVFYALQETLGLVAKEPELLSDESEALIKLLTAEELRYFMMEELDMSYAQQTALQNFGRKLHDTIPVENFSKEIGDDPNTAPDKARQMLKTAKGCAKVKDYSSAISMNISILRALPAAMGNAGDKSKKINNILQAAFDQLFDLYDFPDFDDYNRMRIHDHAVQMVLDTRYPLSTYDPHWIDFLNQNVVKENDKQVLYMMDALIVQADNINNLPDLHRLKKMKEQYREIAGMGKPVIPKKIQQPEYAAAKQTMIDEMEAALQSGDQNKYESGRDTLLNFMQENSDALGVRKMAERFFAETKDPKYFETLKDTYISWEWEKVKARYEPAAINKFNGLKVV